MENASKALIIAGAILLSILIIALGVFVFNQAKGAVGNINLDSQSIETFNGQFLQYQGKQSGSSVKALVQKVDSYNKTVKDNRYIDVNPNRGKSDQALEFNTSDPNVLNFNLNISYGKNYTVEFDYNKAGYITRVNYYE